MSPVADPRVWNAVRWLYFGSGLLFLGNVTLGILNVFSGPELTRGQVLAHLHSGTIGWITLSVIATTVWIFTGARVVSARYVAFVKALVVAGLLAATGYVMAFGLAFNGWAPMLLLPLFGIPMWLVIVSAMVFAGAQLRKQAVVTTVHLLFFGALLVASLGATMGVVWGLSLETGADLYPDGADVNPVGAHAAPMDMYLALAFAGLVELLLLGGVPAARWTRAGLAQVILGVAGAVVAILSLYVGIAAIIPLSLACFVAGVVVYLFRVGVRALARGPFGAGRAPALFWAAVAFPGYVVLFVVLVFVYFVPEVPAPHALVIAFAHVTFVGAATNLLLATQSTFAEGSGLLRRTEPVAYWLLNVGLLAFIASEAMADRREGSLLMAIGALAGLVVVWARLGRAAGHGPAPES